MLDALPAPCLDRHLAILGTSDAGKTYAAKGEVEALLGRGARVCVIDPTGVWWGLRLQTDGKTPSPFHLPIFGGLGPKDRAPPHCDVPLAADAGDRLAEAIIAGDFSCIVDVSLMTVGARTRLFTDFAEALMANTRPLHLVIDEAHLFAPQGKVNDPQSGAMVNAANSLVAGGRARGLRVALLSQRPAKLHKDSLTQVQTLVAMLNISPQDRTAVGQWILGNGDKAQEAEIMASLPGLATGEGWVWAPRLGVLDRVRFRRISTFDSSRTPEAGDARGQVRLGELDLAQLRAALAAPAPPAAAAGGKAAPRATPEELAAARQEGWDRGVPEGRRLEREEAAARPLAADPQLKDLINRAEFAGAKGMADRLLGTLQRELEHALRAHPGAPRAGEEQGAAAKSPAVAPRTSTPSARTAPQPAASPPSASPTLTEPQLRLLGALRWWSAMGRKQVARQQVAVLVGWTPTGSNLRNRLSELKGAGLISYPADGQVALSKEGLAAAPKGMFSDAKAVDGLRSVLTAPQVRIVNLLLERGPKLDREAIARAIGWEPGGSNLRNRLSELAGMDVVYYPEPGAVCLTPWVRDLPGAAEARR